MKPIPEFEGLYSACTNGRIFAHSRKGKGGHRGTYLKPWKIGRGYLSVALYTEPRKSKKLLVHRLVALAFIPNPKKLPEVNHKNGNRTDNRPENLEWCTSKHNKAHAWDSGLYKHSGHRHYRTKLTVKQARQIRNTPCTDWQSKVELGNRFGVSGNVVNGIQKGLTWKRLDN